MSIKLINNNEFAKEQLNWFSRQVSQGVMDNWVDGVGLDKILYEYNLIKHADITSTAQLLIMRGLLSEVGLKRLSNTIAAAKKRSNSTKKSLQLMLEQQEIENLSKISIRYNVTISQLIKIKFNI